MSWIVVALLFLGGQWWSGSAPSPPPGIENLLQGRNSTTDAVALRGRVVDAAPTYGRGMRLTLQLEAANDVPCTDLVSVSLRETSTRWRTGDRLELRTKLRRILGFGNFGELDWGAYNARRGIFVAGYAWREEDVTVLPAADGLVDRLRRGFSLACERVGGQGAEILEALIIGDRTGINEPTSVAVRDAGLAHFLAISGSHMALLVVLVVWLVRAVSGLHAPILERFDVFRAAAVLASLAVLAYAAVSGGGVSVARSVCMALAGMAALWRGRPGDALRALGASAVVLAWAMPGVGEEAGFHLSYLAVLALVMDARRRRGQKPDQPTQPESLPRKAVEFLFEAARLTVVCWLVTSPIVGYHFQRISLVAPLANLLAAPLVSAIVVSGIAGLVVLPWSPTLGHWAVLFGAFLSDLVVRLSVWCASLPSAATTTPAPGAWLAAVLSALALGCLLPAGRARRALVPTLAMAAAILVAHGYHARYRSDRLDVWFASVGQGDAAIVRRPGGEVWVVDQGPPGRGRMVVGPLLRRAWIGRVDVLMASHLQSDHSGAITEILEEFDVGEVWLPNGPCDSNAFRRLMAVARERDVPVRFVSREMVAAPFATTKKVPAPTEDSLPRAPHLGVEVLGPRAGENVCDDNDQSLVVAFDFAGRRVLFTGDIEAIAEGRLVTAGLDLRADVLKVPHHGSRTSSTEGFLVAVAPTLAVASVGLDNQFHHPAPEVEARYAAHGARLLRTDLYGAVHLTIDADGSMATTVFRGAAKDAAP